MYRKQVVSEGGVMQLRAWIKSQLGFIASKNALSLCKIIMISPGEWKMISAVGGLNIFHMELNTIFI